VATFLVLLGPPGAGKGTQAKRLAGSLELPHISSGDIFREHLQENSELGEEARAYMDRGELVPDDVTIAMIGDRLSRADCGGGAILDGFPRTINQAKGLDGILEDLGSSLAAVLYIEVGEDELTRRLTGRLVCRAKGHIYHRDFNPPQKPDICDVDGSELYQRPDDQEETVRNRIKVYRDQTSPLIEHYTGQGLLVTIDGEQGVNDVADELLSVVEEMG
jgi:adenylate kinase